ncbi:MAG: hexokinase [Candidatus Omnitrophota bacterium]
MKGKIVMQTAKMISNLKKDFSFSLPEIRKLIRNFHDQIKKGLKGEKSSLKMIPSYVDKATGKEKGRFIALDLGGTNLRILELELRPKGKTIKLAEKKYVVEKEYRSNTRKELFDFIAECIKNFIVERPKGNWDLGFTFSFPIKQTGVASGILLHWTKDFSAKGVRGKDVVSLLESALSAKGVQNVRITALVNDTVGTLVSRSYKDQNCDIGVILGTGTNACYREKISNIIKWKQQDICGQYMIVNMEWGNFNKLKTTIYDKLIDNESINPREQILEKMVSGMYLGEICRVIILCLIKNNLLFGNKALSYFNKKDILKTEYMSEIEADNTSSLSRSGNLLQKIGISESSFKDRALIKKICKLVSVRSASIIAAGIAAIVKQIDPAVRNKHTVAIDGSVYEKHPEVSRHIKSALRKIFGNKADKIHITLTKDGSGIGAAIIAAVVDET